MHIEELLKDVDYVTGLLNGPCRPIDESRHVRPIVREWVDTETSASVTDVFHRLLPEEIPYMTYVLAERNPDTIFEGACVDDNEKRLRYFVICIIPDTEYPFDYSFPLIHQHWMVGLHCWEIIRATLKACTKEMQVRITNSPVPPILNNAIIEWISLYVGRKPYHGISRLSEQWKESEDFDGSDVDVHLYKAREMEADPLLRRLIDAYDHDYPQDMAKGNKGDG